MGAKGDFGSFRGCGWIWYGSPGYDNVNVYMMARAEVSLRKISAGAVINITADARYKLFVNGKYVCSGPARGYPASYPFDRVRLPRMDPGKNVISVLVHQFGHGTYQHIYAGAAGLLVSGRIGGVDIGTKPGRWLVKRSEGHSQNMARRSGQMGYQENFDARREPPSWQMPSGSRADGENGWTYGSWRPAGSLPWTGVETRGIPLLKEDVTAFKKILAAYSGECSTGWENARNLTELHLSEKKAASSRGIQADAGNMLKPGSPPAEIPPLPAGKHLTLVLDAGEEATGFAGIKASGSGGEVIDLTTSEAFEGGRLLVESSNSRCTVCPSDRIILRGGENNFETFALHGFRYLALTVRNVSRPLKICFVYFRRSRYDFKEKAVFSSSDSRLNRIWDMCLRTQINCSLDAYIDCPWREQAQYWGDAMVQGENTFYLFGDMKLYRRGIKQAGESQLACGLTFGHFPTSIVHSCVLPDFTLAWIRTHMDYYRFSGDKTLLREQFSNIQKALGFFREHIEQNRMLGPMPEWWVFMDWAPLCREGYSAVFNLLYLFSLKEAIEICRVLGENHEKYRAEAGSLESKIVDYFWSERDGVFYDGFDPARKKRVRKLSQHAHALAVLLDLKPEFHRRFAEKILLPPMTKLPPAGNKIVEGTPFFYYYILNALKKIGGYEDEIINFMRKRWGEMLDEGATACYENWEPVHGSTSLCHAWSAHPVIHIANIIPGIRPLAPGWRKFSITPRLSGLDMADISIPVPSGRISARLEKAGGIVRAVITVPENTAGFFSAGGVRKNLKPGRHSLFYREK